jgi:STE24 endopeptidase
MHPFALTFLVVLLLGAALRAWLAARQISFVAAHRARVPAAFAGAVTAEAHAKAADYTVARTRFGIVVLAVGTLLTLAWTLGGGFAALDDAMRELGLGPIATGTLVLVALVLIGELIELPLGWWQAFRLEERFGFNRSTPGLFVRDAVKGLVLSVLLTAALAALALAMMRIAPAEWWLWVWALVVSFSLGMTVAYPTLIAPLFNRFTPLADEALRQRVEALLARCGFESRGVSVMDASQRSAHGNAYFTGFGAAKRIVLFDTLLDRLQPDEVEAVLAHELGHFRLDHVRRRLLAGAAGSLVLLYASAAMAADVELVAALGAPTPSNHATLALLALVAPAFLLPLKPLSAWWSRRHEFEADDYARQMSDGEALARALVVLYRENASTLTPDPWYSAFHDSHPPPAVRLQRLAEARAP